MSDNGNIMRSVNNVCSDKRYKIVVTQSVLEELETLIGQETEIDYMVFKELSELLEETRKQTILDIRRTKENKKTEGILDNKNSQNTRVVLKSRLQSSFALYRRANHLFHTIYNQEINRYRKKLYVPL